ncbi:MAG TPA: hypothetical protein PLV52_07340 [Candidatus Omnitrophota bacterium]|mgnify:CR=1 FL=1|nr:hypothetical protein [Candidatus Omnitrophota bacterium]
MRLEKIAILISLAIFTASNLSAQDASTAINTDNKTKKEEFSQGAKDAILGWTEIPKSVVQVTNESKNPLTGLTRGALKGITRAFSKTVSGIAHAVSPSTHVASDQNAQDTGANR